MDNKQLYDAISDIDEEFTDRASRRVNNRLAKGKSQSQKYISIAALAALALSAVLLVTGTVSVIISTNSIKNNDDPLPGGDLPSQVTEIRKLNDTSEAEIRYSRSGESSGNAGKNSKELKDCTGIYLELTYPSYVKNGGLFEFRLSIGLDADYDEYLETPYGGITKRSPEVAVIENYIGSRGSGRYVSFIVTSDHTYNGNIPFNLGDYKKYGEKCQNSDFTFDGSEGMLVEEIARAQAKELFFYKFGPGFTLNGTLPYQRTVNATSKTLNAGSSGRISAAVHFTSGETLMESNGQFVGYRLYYYCAGDVIGFGDTLEEAKTNAAGAEIRNIIYVFDGYNYTRNEVERYRAIYEEYKKRGITIVY